MTYVLLPISEAAYKEIAEQVIARGQPERVDTRLRRVDLSDVVIVHDDFNRVKVDADRTD